MKTFLRSLPLITLIVLSGSCGDPRPAYEDKAPPGVRSGAAPQLETRRSAPLPEPRVGALERQPNSSVSEPEKGDRDQIQEVGQKIRKMDHDIGVILRDLKSRPQRGSAPPP